MSFNHLFILYLYPEFLQTLISTNFWKLAMCRTSIKLVSAYLFFFFPPRWPFFFLLLQITSSSSSQQIQTFWIGPAALFFLLCCSCLLNDDNKDQGWANFWLVGHNGFENVTVTLEQEQMECFGARICEWTIGHNFQNAPEIPPCSQMENFLIKKKSDS